MTIPKFNSLDELTEFLLYQEKRIHELELVNAKLTARLEQELEDHAVDEIYFNEWDKTVEAQGYGTAGHTQRVTHMFVTLAQSCGINGEKLEIARKGARLHDIGELSIPEEILNKPGPLTEDEWQIIRKHPLVAFDVLSSVELLNPALEIPLFHHENWDGMGYPYHLREEEIPLAARIFSIVDVYDALISRRPYKPGVSEKEALEIIKHQSGKQFDPKVVNCFVEKFFSQS